MAQVQKLAPNETKREKSQLSEKIGQLKLQALNGKIVGNTRREIEENIGKSIVSPINAKEIKGVK